MRVVPAPDVLPVGVRRRPVARDAALVALLAGELLAGVGLRAAWQARDSSPVPAAPAAAAVAAAPAPDRPPVVLAPPALAVPVAPPRRSVPRDPFAVQIPDAG